MSQKNGDRSRFNRQRKEKMHNRTAIRNLKKAMQIAPANTGPEKATTPTK